MNRPMYVRGTMVEDGQVRELVIADGVVADAAPLPSREPDAAGWVLPGLADVHNHLSLASPAGDHEEPAIRVRASASVELAVGVLAIREPGSPDDASMLLADETGWPRVVTAGRFLSPPVPGPDPQGRSYQTYASFSDPDGNGWLLQEIKTRLPGREWDD